MDKQQILEAVSRALDSMGVGEPDGDEYGEAAGVGADNSVPIWSKLQVNVPDAGRGPIHDKKALFSAMAEQSKPPMVDNYGMPYDDEAAEMMTATGMI